MRRIVAGVVLPCLCACASAPTRTEVVFLNASSPIDVFVVESLDTFPTKRLAHTNVWTVQPKRSAVIYNACVPLGFVTKKGPLPFYELQDVGKRNAEGLPVIEVDLSRADTSASDADAEAEREKEMLRRVAEYRQAMGGGEASTRSSCSFPK